MGSNSSGDPLDGLLSTGGGGGGGIRRRKRAKYEQFNDAQLSVIALGGGGGVGNSNNATGSRSGLLSAGMESPFEYSGDTIDEYKQKANLSPWTPVPDSVARKIFDTAQPGPDDVRTSSAVVVVVVVLVHCSFFGEVCMHYGQVGFGPPVPTHPVRTTMVLLGAN
jgi:hypothetical protein